MVYLVETIKINIKILVLFDKSFYLKILSLF